MINIKLDMQKNTIDIVGHACFGESGKDIVCAGVSTLAYTLLNYLHNMNSEHKSAYMFDNVNKGNMHIEFMPTDRFSDEADIVLNFFVLGIKQIVEQYPENVSISIV